MTEKEKTPTLPTTALVVSILLFAGIYLWGLVMSLTEMAQKSAPASSNS